MVSILFFILASICNAIMDNLSHHWYKSVFRHKDPKFWNPLVSCNTAKYIPHTKYKVDAWHLLKSAMIVFLALGVSLAYITEPIGNIYIHFIVLGMAWNATFNLFYNKLLISL